MNTNNWYVSSDWDFRERTRYELPGAFMEGDTEGRFNLEVKGSRGQRGEVERQLSETETETEKALRCRF